MKWLWWWCVTNKKSRCTNKLLINIPHIIYAWWSTVNNISQKHGLKMSAILLMNAIMKSCAISWYIRSVTVCYVTINDHVKCSNTQNGLESILVVSSYRQQINDLNKTPPSFIYSTSYIETHFFIVGKLFSLGRLDWIKVSICLLSLCISDVCSSQICQCFSASCRISIFSNLAITRPCIVWCLTMPTCLCQAEGSYWQYVAIPMSCH